MDLVPLVQMAYNHSPSPSLGGVAPVEAMMGMVAMLPSDMVVVPGKSKPISMEDLMCVRKKEMDEMKKSLDAIHAEIAQMVTEKRKEKKSEMRNYPWHNLTRVISLPIWMCAEPPRRSLAYCGRARPKLKRRFPLGSLSCEGSHLIAT
jgi:hypothetical protein